MAPSPRSSVSSRAVSTTAIPSAPGTTPPGALRHERVHRIRILASGFEFGALGGIKSVLRRNVAADRCDPLPVFIRAGKRCLAKVGIDT